MKQLFRMISVALFGVGLLCQANTMTVTMVPVEASICGQVVDKETGAPVRYCQVTLRWMFSNIIPMDSSSYSARPPYTTNSFSRNVYFTCSTDQGFFAFTNLLTQGSERYEIEIKSTPYHEEIRTGSLSPGVNDHGVIQLTKRPFYFENIHSRSNVVSAVAVNTTRRPAYMRFWLTGILTRLDDSAFFGCNAAVPLQLKQKGGPCIDYATYKLNPGANRITLPLRNYGPNIAVSQITLSGGRSYLEPMMPSTYVMHIDPVLIFEGILPPRTNIIIAPTNIIIGPFPTNLTPPITIPMPTNPPPVILPRPPAWPTNPPVIGPFPTNRGYAVTIGVNQPLLRTNVTITPR